MQKKRVFIIIEVLENLSSKIENSLMGVCIEERPGMHWVSNKNFNFQSSL